MAPLSTTLPCCPNTGERLPSTGKGEVERERVLVCVCACVHVCVAICMYLLQCTFKTMYLSVEGPNIVVEAYVLHQVPVPRECEGHGECG